jgi:hypothetical protein
MLKGKSMPNLNERIKLVPKTEQDKVNLVIHGETYKVIGVQLGKAFDNKDGPWFLLRSVTTGIYKWVHESDDKHYSVEEIR